MIDYTHFTRILTYVLHTHTHTAHTYTNSHTHTHTLSHTHTSLEASSKRATADAAHNYCRFVKLSALAWVAFPPLPSPYLPLPQYVKFFAPLPLSFCGFADTCVRQPKENFAAVPIIFSFASFFLLLFFLLFFFAISISSWCYL